MDWKKLLAEIQNNILQALLQGLNAAHCASVCREWQTVFAQHNFQSLRLTQHEIPLFKIMTARNIGLVKYIWYSIELPEYTEHQSTIPELNCEWNYNAGVIERSLKSLSDALIYCPCNGQRTLDISIYSPSDTQHHFKYVKFEPADSTATISPRKLKVPLAHGDSVITPAWILPTAGEISRVFARAVMHPGWWGCVTNIPCITHLILRRQTRRRWGPQNLIKLINRLPNLEDVCLERWAEFEGAKQGRADDEMCRLLRLQHQYPTKLKRVRVFEDFNEKYIEVLLADQQSQDVQPVRVPRMDVTQEFASLSFGLENFSAAFIINASDFWAVRSTVGKWERLRTLALTSSALNPQSCQGAVDYMLFSAAQAASAMPRLELMELWNGRRGYAGVFRFQHPKSRVWGSITWRGTWPMKLSTSLVAAWETAVGASRSGYLAVRHELLEPVEILSHGDAIVALGLETEVACPVSIQQMRKEHAQVELQKPRSVQETLVYTPSSVFDLRFVCMLLVVTIVWVVLVLCVHRV